MNQIIDAHSHYMPPEVAQNTAFFKQGWSDVGKQLEIMDQHGIEKSLLLYPTSDAHLNIGGWNKLAEIYNHKISEIIAKYPDRFIGACVIPFNDPMGRDSILKSFQNNNFKVLSLSSSCEGVYLDDDFFKPVFEYAQAKHIPIHVHAQIMNPIGSERVNDPLLSPVLEYVFDVSMCIGKMMMSGVFLQFPDVKFIFPHYGGVLPIVKERFDSTYGMLRKRNFVKDLSKSPSEYFKNLYFDTSGSKSVASLLCALEVTDPSHLLFGSDFPANQNISSSIDVLQQSNLSKDDIHKIRYSNILSLLN
ncbi:MAG: amidohydrolase family protein [Candidatus Omnitrophica bacterium]|nr:amidohydrolase family protein [Candidatus Omnitrophota bacterium]